MYILIALFNVDICRCFPNQKLKISERFEGKQKNCVRIKRSYNRAVLQSVFFFRLSDMSLFGGVYIDALLQPYSKRLPIKK